MDFSIKKKVYRMCSSVKITVEIQKRLFPETVPHEMYPVCLFILNKSR